MPLAMTETVTSKPPALISDEYRQIQRRLHENPDYGVASVAYAPLVADVVGRIRATELLDYGAGKGRLGVALQKLVKWPLKIQHYDPAIPHWAAAPAPAQLVACIDVLEHIEPSLLDNVLDDLQRVTLRVGLFTISTRAAHKILPDGRNAHLIQQPSDWWLPRLMSRFELVHFSRMEVDEGFWVLVEPKGT